MNSYSAIPSNLYTLRYLSYLHLFTMVSVFLVVDSSLLSYASALVGAGILADAV